MNKDSCPLCGKDVLYRGLNNIECAGSYILLSFDEKDPSDEGEWGACPNYRVLPPVEKSSTDEDWIEKFKDELRVLSWLADARVCAHNMFGFQPGAYWPNFWAPRAVFSPASGSVYVRADDYAKARGALQAVLAEATVGLGPTAGVGTLKSAYPPVFAPPYNFPPMPSTAPGIVPFCVLSSLPPGLALAVDQQRWRRDSISRINSVSRGADTMFDDAGNRWKKLDSGWVRVLD